VLIPLEQVSASPPKTKQEIVNVKGLLRLQVAHCPQCDTYWVQEASPPAAPLCDCGYNCINYAAEVYAESPDAAVDIFRRGEEAGEMCWQKET